MLQNLRLPARLQQVLPVVFLLTACASTSEQEVSMQEELTLPGDRARARMENQAIGVFLRDINGTIRAWTQLTMTARSEEDRRKVALLEQELSRRTYERIEELIHELESGPPPNRVVAASALGFAHDDRALSPLLAALEDPNVEVQSNALLGLRLLGFEETPLERVCELMRYGEDAWVRSNAASCASTLVNAGSRSDCVREAARSGLNDSEPGVRSHCTLILATLVDGESVAPISDLLEDEVPLVRSAAMRSLAYLGREDLSTKAAAAKALVRAFMRSSGTERYKLLRSLEELSGRHYGEDDDEWMNWAHRLQ